MCVSISMLFLNFPSCLFKEKKPYCCHKRVYNRNTVPKYLFHIQGWVLKT